MSEVAVGDRVRILSSRKPGLYWLGTVVGITARDRTHVNRRVKGRPEAMVTIDGQERPGRFPLGSLRKVE